MSNNWWAFEDGKRPPSGDLTKWPRRGASLYGLYGDPGWDYRTFAHILSDCGLNWTTWWGWGGWINWEGRMPFQRVSPNGPWDLYKWNEKAFDDAEEMVSYLNSYGIRVLWNIVDLYPWSAEKSGLPGIINADNGPFRFNVNSLRWGTGPGSHPDDPFYLEAPNGGPVTGPPWLRDYILKLVGRLKGLGVDFQTGNECPESGLQDRIRDLVKSVWPEARVTTSRNSDSPGQYANMVEAHHFEAINFHGWKNMERMFEVFHEEDGTGRPQTYEQLLNSSADKSKIIACSDGARSNTTNYPYDLPHLLEAFRYAAEHGCGIDHQSGAKMVLYNEGRHDLSYVETDFLKDLAKL